MRNVAKKNRAEPCKTVAENRGKVSVLKVCAAPKKAPWRVPKIVPPHEKIVPPFGKKSPPFGKKSPPSGWKSASATGRGKSNVKYVAFVLNNR